MKQVLLLALGLLQCGGGPSPLRVERQPTAAGLRLILYAEVGARINARLKPALELANGQILRFDAAELSPDSAYFAAPPSLVLPRQTALAGTIRASVCRADEHVCRMVVLRLL